jgi:hypothetical protein
MEKPEGVLCCAHCFLILGSQYYPDNKTRQGTTTTNYRLISLMNKDVKILKKMLAN